MSDLTSIEVRITAASGQQSKGLVRLQTWDKSARTRRALKIWAMCWLAALVTVVIPLAHFVLVPGFFLAGPIAAYLVYSSQSVVLGGEGVCPSCGEVLPIAHSSDQWPLTDLCTKCQKSLKIEKL